MAEYEGWKELKELRIINCTQEVRREALVAGTDKGFLPESVAARDVL